MKWAVPANTIKECRSFVFKFNLETFTPTWVIDFFSGCEKSKEWKSVERIQTGIWSGFSNALPAFAMAIQSQILTDFHQTYPKAFLYSWLSFPAILRSYRFVNVIKKAKTIRMSPRNRFHIYGSLALCSAIEIPILILDCILQMETVGPFSLIGI